MALRFSSCHLTARCFLRSLGVAVLFLGIVAPTHGAVDLIGDISNGLIADPWIITQQTTIGFSEATILDVYDGGVVDSNTFLIIGDEANSSQYVQVNVRDAGSSFSARDLIVGNFGAVPRVYVENGGAVVVDKDLEMRSKSTLIVTDPGSQLTIGNNFLMASSTEIIVANGGTVESGVNPIGGMIITSVSTATIKGSGSTWTDHNALQVSNLRVEDGAQLISTNDSSFAFSISGDANLDGGTIIAERISRSGGGRLNFHSGTLIFNQAGLTVGSSGLLGSDVHVDSISTIDVSGEVIIDAGSELVVAGTLASSGVTNNGTLVLQGASLEQSVTSPAGSTIDVIGDVMFNGLVSGAGGIFGSGTATFNGGYSPGDSPAVVPIETDLALGALNLLNIELAGTASGEFDQLNIAGDVSLAGALDISLIDGFALDPQQQFTILDIEGELTGQFDGLAEGARVGGSNGVDLFITYAAGGNNDVALFTTAIPEPTSMALLTSALFALLLGRKHCYAPCFKPCLGAMMLSLLCVSPSFAAIQTAGSVAPAFQAGLFVDPMLNVIPWNPSSLQVGHVGPERGLLVISDTSRKGFNHDTVNVDSSILVGGSVPGTLVVTGSDAQLTGDLFKIGNAAPGLFLVSDGASVVTGEAEGESRIGGDPVVGTGQAIISNSGSNWTHYDLNSNSLGELSVTNGASVHTTNLARISGPITITDTGSVWNVGGLVMSAGSASVVVADGGQVNVMGEYFLPFPGVDPILFENQGVRMSNGSLLTIRGGTFTTNYFTSFNPGSLNFEHGTLNLSDSGLVVGAAGLMGDAVDITSSSAINLSDDVTVEAGATLTVAGTLSSASLNNNGNLTLVDTTLDQPVTSPAGSVMNVIGDVTFNAAVSGAGDIFGSGTSTFNGGYNPGDSPAVVEIEHDIIFGAANTLTIELAGLLAGEFDALQIGGNATLAGELSVELLGGFELDPHQEFLILDVAGERTGQFTDLEEGDNVGMFGEFGGLGNFGDTPLFISYEGGDGNDVVLYTTPTLEGDFDADGDVDGSDFLAWQRTDGTPEGLSDWQMNYGTPSNVSASAVSVPEPSSFLLLLTSYLLAAYKSQR